MRVCVCVRESMRVCERERVCVCVCVCGRESMRVCKRERVCVYAYVYERESATREMSTPEKSTGKVNVRSNVNPGKVNV